MTCLGARGPLDPALGQPHQGCPSGSILYISTLHRGPWASLIGKTCPQFTIEARSLLLVSNRLWLNVTKTQNIWFWMPQQLNKIDLKF